MRYLPSHQNYHSYHSSTRNTRRMQTLTGMIAAQSWPTREEKTTTSNMKLSSPQSTGSMYDAILLGGSTCLWDAPTLNVRLPSSTESSCSAQHDTNLNHLQLLLFDKIVSTALPSQSQSSKEEILTIEKSEPTIPSFAVRPMPLDHSLTFSKSSKISKQQNERERKVTRLQYTKK